MAELVGVGAVNVTCYFLPTNRTPVKALTGRVADNGRQNVRGRQLKMLSIHCAGNSGATWKNRFPPNSVETFENPASQKRRARSEQVYSFR